MRHGAHDEEPPFRMLESGPLMLANSIALRRRIVDTPRGLARNRTSCMSQKHNE